MADGGSSRSTIVRITVVLVAAAALGTFQNLISGLLSGVPERLLGGVWSSCFLWIGASDGLLIGVPLLSNPDKRQLVGTRLLAAAIMVVALVPLTWLAMSARVSPSLLFVGLAIGALGWSGAYWVGRLGPNGSLSRLEQSPDAEPAD